MTIRYEVHLSVDTSTTSPETFKEQILEKVNGEA